MVPIDTLPRMHDVRTFLIGTVARAGGTGRSAQTLWRLPAGAGGPGASWRRATHRQATLGGRPGPPAPARPRAQERRAPAAFPAGPAPRRTGRPRGRPGRRGLLERPRPRA